MSPTALISRKLRLISVPRHKGTLLGAGWKSYCRYYRKPAADRQNQMGYL
jgi:hypothetical protein